MRADMLWQLSIESGACEYMEFTHEDEKLIRLACAYVVLVIHIWLAPCQIILLLIMEASHTRGPGATRAWQDN